VGKLKEELKVDHIHVEAYSDIILRKYRMELALRRLGEVKRDFDDEIRLPLDNLSKLLENRIEQPYNLRVFWKISVDMQNLNTIKQWLPYLGGGQQLFTDCG